MSSRGKIVTVQIKEQRRKQAEERAVVRAARTDQEQLDLLTLSFPEGAVKEKARLQARIAKGGK